MSAAPFFSVVLCTYDRYDRLPAAVASVLNQDFPADLFDLWIVDNTPPGPARAASRALYADNPRVHYLEEDVPGLAHARNRALAEVQAPWAIFLDDDAVAGPGWLAAYQAAIAKLGPDVVSVGGRVEPLFEAPRPPWLHDQLLMFLSVLHGGDVLAEMPPGEGPVGANMALRREQALAAGGFNILLGRNGAESQNLMSGEETSLFAALRAAGGRIFFAPEACVTHAIPASRLTRSWFRRRVGWQMVSGLSSFRPSEDQKMAFWIDLMQYLPHVPREHIPYMGLFWDTDDPVLFCKQIQCIQYAAFFLLGEGGYPAAIRQGAQ